MGRSNLCARASRANVLSSTIGAMALHQFER
jgi:hypothetical protein